MLDATIRRGATLAALIALLFGVGLVGAGSAAAQGRVSKQIEGMTKEAMENYDLLDIDAAKKQLNEALILAKKNNLEDDPIMAKVHLHLGIVNFAGFKDAEAAKLNFIDAVRLDPDIQIGVGYKTAEMEALLDEARAEFGGGGGGGTAVIEPEDEVDCASLQGIAHTLVDSARSGADKDISAHVASDLGAAKVSLHYRSQGAADFTEVKMAQAGDCKFTGTIPADAFAGSFLHYYVAAHNEAGKVIASKGSTGSPNIIEVAGGSTGTGDTENPLENENPLGGGGGTGGGIQGGTTVGPKTSKLFLTIALGTGGGYVTGETEQELNEVGCCFAPALLHLFPEVGYYLSPKSSVSLAFRMGFPVGANITGHATAAPGALLRYRQALGDGPTGIVVNGAIGGGIIRHTVKLTDAVNDEMDTDTVASGPLFIGGGAAWVKDLGGPFRFLLEANALAGIPIISEFGPCPEDPEQTEPGCVRPNFGLQVDLNMGLIFSF
jgi:hypothetical protein